MSVPTDPGDFSNLPPDTNPVDADAVNERFQRLYEYLGAGVELLSDDLLAELAKAGISVGSENRSDSCIIATQESRTNTAYGTLTTPDQIDDLVLGEGELLFVLYHAIWKESVAGAASAALFLDGNQVKQTPAIATAAPSVQEAGMSATPSNVATVLGTHAGGLGSRPLTGGGATAYSGDVTTGQILDLGPSVNSGFAGGLCILKAAAGTHDLSVRFKASSGSVTAESRSLYAWVKGF